MIKHLLRLFDYMRRHRALRATLFVVVTAVLCVAALRLHYEEDISRFLPIDKGRQEALRAYQDAAGADNFVVVATLQDTARHDPDLIVAAIDAFADAVKSSGGEASTLPLTYRIDMEQAAGTVAFLYRNIPYFMLPADYARIDTLLAQADYVDRVLERDKQMLMFPGAGLQGDNIGRDPLALFAPVAERLRGLAPNGGYESYGGYLFTPDMKHAVAVMRSPYGSSETEHNAQLLDTLQRCALLAAEHVEGTAVHITGGPAIAVGNASQMKQDSVLSVSVAVALILLLLAVAFRSTKNIVLIALSIAWGWLFALGGLAALHSHVSIIVLGISSVILGIAVNYPLHLIAHLYHTDSVRAALKEVAAPLVVGNITTVGAFLCLVPLNAEALRDLGWFSSFLLVGTIIFVLLFLPHMVKPHRPVHTPLLDRVCNISLENKPAVVVVVLLLTVVLGAFSLRVKFDTNMAHLNYMTAEQQSLLKALESGAAGMRDGAGGGHDSATPHAAPSTPLYVVSSDATADGALDKSLALQTRIDTLQACGAIICQTGCTDFIISERAQKERLARWQAFVAQRGDSLEQTLRRSAAAAGFAPDAFNEFAGILHADYAPQPLSHFAPLTEGVFRTHLSADSAAGRFCVIDVLAVAPDEADSVSALINDAARGSDCFDIKSLNSTIANNLSDNFNYIGWACAVIVFFFLWFSLGSIELAMLSFLPMAISWLWILGIMALGDIRFNIVNIILATFIFGQGDDYTIFMTEGSSYEYAYRRRLLPAYKRSIMLSALIMFIGIGSLILARHPALRSLAQVTIVGMFSVVLMAYLLSPWCFNLLVRRHGRYRLRPLSLRSMGATAVALMRGGWRLAYIYITGRRQMSTGQVPETRQLQFRQTVSRHCGALLHGLPGVAFATDVPKGEDFSRPALLVMRRASLKEMLVALALCPRAVAAMPVEKSHRGAVGRILGWLDVPTEGGADRLQAIVAQGCSPVVFAETLAGDKGEALLHSAAAMALKVVHITTHGLDDVWPDGLCTLYDGTITATAGTREPLPATAAALAEESRSRYHRMALQLETPEYFRALVIDRYRYKGADVASSVSRRLKQLDDYRQRATEADRAIDGTFSDEGHGEYALLYALTHPDRRVSTTLADADRATLAIHSAEGIADNLTIGVEPQG